MGAQQLQEAFEPVGSPIIEKKKKEKLIPRTDYLPQRVWDRLDEFIASTKAEDPEGKGMKQPEVMLQIVEWALDEIAARKAKAAARKSKK